MISFDKEDIAVRFGGEYDRVTVRKRGSSKALIEIDEAIIETNVIDFIDYVTIETPAGYGFDIPIRLDAIQQFELLYGGSQEMSLIIIVEKMYGD